MIDPKLAFLPTLTKQIPQSISIHTFSSPIELDSDLLIHILVQIEYIFLLGFVTTLCTASSIPSRSAVAVAASTPTTPTAEVTSLGHWVACGWMRERPGYGKRKEKRDVRGCGSAALEKRNRWIGRWWFGSLPMRSRRSPGQPRISIFGGPGPVVGVGCGLRCADDDSFLREAQSEPPPHPFLPLFRPISRPSHFLLYSLILLLTPYSISSNSDMEFFPP